MLRTRIYILMLSTLFIFNGCIEEYELSSIYEHEGNIAVSGWITDLPGKQEINLSISTPLSVTVKNPLRNCLVQVVDDEGNTFEYMEKSPGRYVHEYREGEIKSGNSYRLIFVTPEGTRYESEYETIQPSPPVEEIRYEEKMKDTREPGVQIRGLKFYTSVDAGGNENYAGYYKIEVMETYEFHTFTQDVYWFYNNDITMIPADSIRPKCYITEKVPDIFLISTKNLAEKNIPDFPLHFVSNQTQRLQHGYSPQLRLMSLSSAAYTYWDNQKSILEESGGLFETQPPTAQGNIYNIDNPNERILGYFGASSVTTTRRFIPRGVMDEFDIDPYCEPAIIPSGGLTRLYRMGQGTQFFTYAYTPLGAWTLHFITKDCFDCTVYDGSTVEKPEFWEE